MRIIHYECEESNHTSIRAERVADRESDVEEKKLQDCICITTRYFDEETTIYLTREDALHFAETIKSLAESKPKKV